jgi:hypothetical protein
MELPNHLRSTMVVICRPMSATIEALLEGPAKKDRSFRLLLRTLVMRVLSIAKYFHVFSVGFYGGHYSRSLTMNCQYA